MSKHDFEQPGFIIAIDHEGIASLLLLPELAEMPRMEKFWIELDDLSASIWEEVYRVTPGVYRATYYLDCWMEPCGECKKKLGFTDLVPIWTTEGFKP